MTSSISLEMMSKTVHSHIESFLDKNDQRALKCSSSILADNPDALAVDRVVGLVMAHCSDEIYKDKNYYVKWERGLRVLKKENITWLLEKTPTAFLGGLTTWMTPQEIDAHVQGLFKRLKNEHVIISASEFDKIKDKYREPGRHGGGGLSLDRLWGAFYLKDKIGDSSKYKVPKYVIVVNNGIKTLSVKLTKTNEGIPVIQSFATDDARVFVENIQPNEKVADQGHCLLHDYGYVDFADPGNILKGLVHLGRPKTDRKGEHGLLKGPDGNYYIVDTELSALGGCLTKCRKALQNHPGMKYTRMRCDAFNPWSNKIMKIKLELCQA